MTSTSQADPAKDATGSLPADQTPEASAEPRTVPVAAIAEQRQKTRDALAELAELKAELARLKSITEQAAPQRQDEAVHKDIQELKRDKQIRKLVGELGLASDKQGEAVAKILESNKDVTPIEAVDLAARRDRELFKDRGAPGFDPSIHGSLTPSRGSEPSSQPQKSDMQKRFELADKQNTSRRKMSVINNMLGHEAAKAVGKLDHELFKLPD